MIFPLVLVLLILLLMFLFYEFVFLRDPHRKMPTGSNIISPADGKVIFIGDKEKTEVNKGRFGKVTLDNFGYIVCIMMNLHNVHVQRAPIEGKVVDVKYNKGKFRNAVYKAKDMRWIENENNSILIENKGLKVRVIQIAGVLARRINCFVKVGEVVKKGERIGNITLGSMVCLVLPKNVEVKAKEGEKVRAGETIIAKI